MNKLMSHRQENSNSENSSANDQDVLITNAHCIPLSFIYALPAGVDLIMLFLNVLGAKTYLPAQRNIFVGRFSLVPH
jgi:hypothetical protein